MDTAEACKILQLDTPFTHRELKKAYHRSALLKHPDRKGTEEEKKEKTAQFQEVQSAYEFLSIQLELKEEFFQGENDLNNTIDYTTIIKNFMYTCLEITKTDIPEVITSIAEKALQGLDKKILQELLHYLNNYGAVFSNAENMKIITDIIQDKLQKNNIYTIETTIDNLFQAEIFKLNVDDEIYYIPLWHNEIEYDKDGKRLIVKCLPNLPEHMSIDDENNIHIHIKLTLQTVLHNTHVDIYIGSKVFKIPVEELFIRKRQNFLFYKKGIPIINHEDIYSAEHVSDIIVHISLS